MIKGGRVGRISINAGLRIPRIPENELEDTVQKLRGGDYNAYDKMILGHVALAGSIAADYGTVTSFDKEDCLSVALSALVIAVDRIRRGSCEHGNYGAYINKTVNGAIYDFMNTDYLVKPPLRNKVYQETARDTYNKSRFVEIDPRLPIDGHSSVDEIFESTWFTASEKKILRMKYDGYTDKEVAKETGLSFQRIAQIRQNLKPLVMKWVERNR